MSLRYFNHDSNRGKWGSKFEFIVAFVGHGVGLKSFALLYYFYESFGGIAFLIPVAIMSTFISTPLFFLETFMGQFSNTGYLSVFRVATFYKGLGFVMMILNIFSVTYFSVISAYPVAYIYKLFKYETSWYIEENNITSSIRDDPMLNAIITNETRPNIYIYMKASQLFKGYKDESFAVLLMAIIPFVWLLVALCQIKGIKWLGKIMYFTFLVPLILVISLSVRTLFPVGNQSGESFWGVVDLSKLEELSTWMWSGIFCIHILGQGWGILIVLGSYNKLQQPLKNYAYLLPWISIIICLIQIIPIRMFGHFLRTLAIPSERVIDGGQNLAFLLFPDFISYLNESQAWSVIFYLAFFGFEFHSILIQTFSILTTIFDEFVKLRNYKMSVTVSFCIFVAVIGVIFGSQGFYPPVDKLLYYFILISIVIYLFEVLAFVWSQMKPMRFRGDMEFIFSKSHQIMLYLIYVTPIFLCTELIWLVITGMPFLPKQTTAWPAELSLIFFCCCFLCIPLYVFCKFMYRREGPWSKKIEESLKPYKWHPAEDHERLRYINVMRKYNRDRVDIQLNE